MQVVLELEKARAAVTRAQAGAQRGGTIPILGNLLLAADGAAGTFTVVGTDLDLETASTVYGARVHESGSITVPGQTLLEILRNTPQGAEVALDLAHAPQRLSVRAGRAAFKLPVLPASDFPVFDPPREAAKGLIEAKALRRLIDRTQFALGGEKETRTYLQCLCLDFVEVAGAAVLRAIATDGARLAMAWAPTPAGLERAPRTLLSKRTLGEVRALCDEEADGSEAVELAIAEGKIEVVRGTHRLTSKVVEGTYANYERVIPTGKCPVLRTDAKALAAALRRAAIVAGALSGSTAKKGVVVEVSSEGLTVSSHNTEGGEARETVEVAYDGPPLTLKYNVGYLIDALGNMARDVEIEFRSPDDPTKVLDPADPASLFVLMPLKV